jgi:hypothetical protein
MIRVTCCPRRPVRARQRWLAGTLLALTAAGAGFSSIQSFTPAERLSRAISLSAPANPPLLSRPAGAVSSARPLVALCGSTGSTVAPTANVVWEEFFDGEWGIAQLAGPCSVGTLDPSWEATARRIDAPAGGPTGRKALSPRLASWSSDHPYVHVVYREVSDTGQRVFHAYSSQSGAGGWSTPVALGPSTGYVGPPALCTQEIGGNRHVFVAWTQNDSVPEWSGEEGLRLAVSSDGGLTFGAPMVVPTPNGRAMLPSVAPGMSSGEVYLGWVAEDDDLTAGGYRAMLQRWNASGAAGVLHAQVSNPLAQQLTELQLVSVPSRQGALMMWAEEAAVEHSLWYHDASDTVDSLAVLPTPGPDPLQVDVDLAVDESAGLVLSVLPRTEDVFVEPMLVWSRVLDLSPLPSQPPVWSTSGGVQGLQPISTQNATGYARPRPRIAVSGGQALVVWMQAGIGPEADFDIMVSTSAVSLTPNWSTPVSITSLPAPPPGHAQSRSGYPRLVLEPGRALAVWDDRRAWSQPDTDTNVPEGSALGAPDVYATLIDL